MKLRDGYLMKKIADEYVLVPFGTRAEEVNKLLNLSETAAFIYMHIPEVADAEEMALLVSSEYGVDLAEVRADVKEVLASMETQGLICME